MHGFCNVKCPREWTAGFLGGDGCIGMYRTGASVRYVQAVQGADNLAFIARHWPRGRQYMLKNHFPDRHQQRLVLTYNGAAAVHHLRDLYPKVGYKRAQAEAVFAGDAALCSNLKKFPTDVLPGKLTLDFIGGFFAAEGHASVKRGTPVIVFTQKHADILHAIRDVFGGAGNIYDAHYMIRSRADCRHVAEALVGKVGAKEPQLRAVLDLVCTKRRHKP